MDSFLKSVAEDLFEKYGHELSDITVVFPNKRARLFFNNHLIRIAQKPVWTPDYTSIQTLFKNASGLEIPDPLKLVSDLFHVYNEEYPQQETFDEFYFWGEILLNDFDDVDKNLVDATALFRNIQEQGQYIDTFEHLSEEQREALRLFFRNFTPDMRTELKERFIRLWNSLIFVYQNFKQKLLEQDLAYEGMLNRIVIENIGKNGLEKFSSQKYVFVGFNVLNKCEKKLFTALQNAGKALFYWDYDSFYMEKKYHEAGTFIRENLSLFPNVFPKSYFNRFNVGEKRNITFVSASTETAQAKFLDDYLKKESESVSYRDSDTAVVLCNESLLLPVLHSVPDTVKEINVTMGFPLLQTPAYGLIKSLLEMQNSQEGKKKNPFRLQTFAPVLNHPYIKAVFPETIQLLDYLTENHRFYPSLDELQKTENLTLLFTPANTSQEITEWLLKILRRVATITPDSLNNNMQDVIYDDLYKEALFRAYTEINKVCLLLEDDDVQLNIQTLTRLLKNILSTITVPFSGEPVKGMQIMGFLETRTLDFKNIVMLSVNEGILPNSGKESSFIPHNLRKGYGMTTIEHKNALYAYYFYRLLQRAENITLIYNTATDGMRKGEMSRFMLQLLSETDFDIQLQDIRSNIRIIEPAVIEIRKNEQLLDILRSRYNIDANPDAYFSASALNCLIDCSLKFYFKYVLNLKAKDELSEEMDASIFGTIFHKAAELLYNESTDETITPQKSETLRKDRKKIEETVDFVFKTEYFKITDNRKMMPEYTGEQLLNRKVIIDFLQKLLSADAQYAPFKMLNSEKKVMEVMEIRVPEPLKIKIGGVIDRIDLREGTLRIVDYKTGGTPLKPSGVASLFEQSKNRANYVFQAFLYAVIIRSQYQGKYIVKPTLFYVHKAGKEYVPDIFFSVDRKSIAIESIADYEEEFRTLLHHLLCDLFDENIPFSQTPVTEKCTYCEFKGICRRRE